MIYDKELSQLRKDVSTIKAISSIFGVSESLVRRWYNGQRGVSPRYREKIRNYLKTGDLLPAKFGFSDCSNWDIDADRRVMIRRDGRVYRP